MEPFMAERPAPEVLALMRRLAALGIRGRDAAYLASIVPPVESGTPEMAMYLKEFEFIVDPAARPAAAALIGIAGWADEDAA